MSIRLSNVQYHICVRKMPDLQTVMKTVEREKNEPRMNTNEHEDFFIRRLRTMSVHGGTRMQEMEHVPEG